MDDCRFVHHAYIDLGENATACGHPENTCVDDFRNHTCFCAPGYEYGISPVTGKPECVDVDECRWDPCGANWRDGLKASGPHTCVNRNGTYECLCAGGYRNNTEICFSPGVLSGSGNWSNMSANSSWNGTVLDQNYLRLLLDAFEEEELVDNVPAEAFSKVLRNGVDFGLDEGQRAKLRRLTAHISVGQGGSNRTGAWCRPRPDRSSNGSNESSSVAGGNISINGTGNDTINNDELPWCVMNNDEDEFELPPNSRHHLGFQEIFNATFHHYMTVAGEVLYEKTENGTAHCFAHDNSHRVVEIVAPIYRRLGWNLHELVTNLTIVSLKTTCAEIDECLETWHACGDPNRFENPCADKINDYDCFCGNFTARGHPSNPCDDFRWPHKLGQDAGNHDCSTSSPFAPLAVCPHRNQCRWVNNTHEYDCHCDIGYVETVHPLTGLEMCADFDDCQPVDGNYASPCGHVSNLCIDEFRNHTCMCAPGFFLDLNKTTNRPMCVDIDECAEIFPPVCGKNHRDGMVADREHICINHEGGYTCDCAPGYRNNSIVCWDGNGVDYPC